MKAPAPIYIALTKNCVLGGYFGYVSDHLAFGLSLPFLVVDVELRGKRGSGTWFDFINYWKI